MPVVKRAEDLLQPAASTKQIGVRERLQAIRQQREQPERSPQKTFDDAAAQQEQEVRSVADYAAKYRAQNKNSAPKHHRGRSR